jgi:hypothetical protein
LVRVARVENHILIVVLDTVEFFDHFVMAIVEGDERDNVLTDIFKSGMRLNILLHCLANRS